MPETDSSVLRNGDDGALVVALNAWVAGQRWYAGKGGHPALRQIGVATLVRGGDALVVATHLFLDESSAADDSPGTLYQIPLTYRRQPRPELSEALVTNTDTHYIYDGPHDPAYTQALLDLMYAEGSAGDEVAGLTLSLVGHAFSPADDGVSGGSSLGEGSPQHGLEVARAAVLSGEQSNTSIIVTTRSLGPDTGDPAPKPSIIKIFRVLHDGENPDVVVQSALASAGSSLVPRPLGHVSGLWSGARGVAGQGHLAFAQEFLPGVQDAWRTALVAAQANVDFTERAAALGAATAIMHATLLKTMGAESVTDERRTELAAQWRDRSADALAHVPDLATHTEAIELVFAAAEHQAWPEVQRIHGDYHLGQVLDAPERGWVLLDFEGEPLRPLAQRSLPDLPVRDVAGMLRSFDYAAGSVEREHDLNRDDWAAGARAAFLEGYAEHASHDPRHDVALLRALELDKALYEVVYEVRNRPSWAPIPIAAIGRLLADVHVKSDSTTAAPQTAPDLTNPSQETIVPTATSPNAKSLPTDEVELLIRGHHGDPHSLLGAHPYDGGVTVRTLRPLAQQVVLVLPGDERVTMEHETHGIFCALLDTETVKDYRLEVTWSDGVSHTLDDPYRFLPTVGEIDQHLINEGRHEQLWTVLGAHVHRYDGPMGEVVGTSFAVWAPNARSVNVVGDFNQWDGMTLPMRSLGASGIWELFVPVAGVGSRYKFDITGADGHRTMKADPMARAAEIAPASASIVTQATHEWNDSEWIEHRDSTPAISAPMSVYEVHLGSWCQGLSYRELATQLVDYVSDLGFTHVEFMPVMQHPFGPSWGYHVTGYYAADARLGGPEDLKLLIDAMHQAGIGVILDWVPGHFATDPWALARFDGQALYEHPDPRKGWHQEWGSYVFDFGRPQVRNFLVANALFWLEEFHADGLRVDGVASMLYLDYSREEGEWIPNEFGGNENLDVVRLLQETNATAYRRHPGVTIIAEESTSWPGVTKPTNQDGLGFGFKWNMGWMNDSLDYMSKEPVYREHHHHQLTFSLVYAFSENFVLPISHDEVVHGKGSLLRKMPGDRWKQLANLRAFLAFMWSHPGKQLLFMGTEFAQESEWADGRSLDWWLLNHPEHSGIADLVRDMNNEYTANPGLWQLDHTEEGFQWLDADNASGNTYSYLRRGLEDARGNRSTVVALVNFGDGPRDVHVGLPRGGVWREALNTDATTYGGSGVGNMGRVSAAAEPHQGQSHSAHVVVPPLGVLWLTPLPADNAATAASVSSASSTQEK